MDTASLDHLGSLEIQVTKGLLGSRASKGSKVDRGTVVVVLMNRISWALLVLRVKWGPQAHQDFQGPQDQKGRGGILEKQENLDKRVFLDFQVFPGSKVKGENLLWWILKVRKETEVCQVLWDHKDSQEEEDLMGCLGPLETVAPKVEVSPVIVVTKATQDSRGQRGLVDFQAQWGRVLSGPSESVGPLGTWDLQDTLDFLDQRG